MLGDMGMCGVNRTKVQEFNASRILFKKSTDERDQKASTVFGADDESGLSKGQCIETAESALRRPLKYFHISRIERAVHDDGENDG